METPAAMAEMASEDEIIANLGEYSLRASGEYVFEPSLDESQRAAAAIVSFEIANLMLTPDE